ncbi:MAG: metallophosphoesterase [Phycisphaeraceae bacterium]
MNIGILSDSHDRLPALARAIELLVEQRVEAILHAGDFIAPFAAKLLLPPSVPASIPVYCCYGNNDGERAGLKKVLPQVVDGPVRLTLGPRKRVIVMHHFIDWLKDEDFRGADVIVTGHTHEIVNTPGTLSDGKSALFLNPGECCGWLTGRCTCAVLDTDSLTARIIDVT